MQDLRRVLGLPTVAGVCLLASGCAGSSSQPLIQPQENPEYIATQIGPVAPLSVAPLSINSSGVVAGTTINKSGSDVPFVWTQSMGVVSLSLAFPQSGSQPSTSSYASGVASGISDSGEVVGWVVESPGMNVASPGQFGALWTSLGSQPLTVPSSSFTLSEFRSIGTNGAVGWGIDASGVTHPIEWNGTGSITDLSQQIGAVLPTAANSTYIVGSTSSGQGFVYSQSASSTIPLPPIKAQSLSYATAVNASGIAVGFSGPEEGCYWVNGVVQAIPTASSAPVFQTYAYGINSSQQIVGGETNGAPYAAAFVTSPQGGFQLLTPITQNLPYAVNLTCACAINDSGAIVTYGSDGNAYLLTPLAKPLKHNNKT